MNKFSLATIAFGSLLLVSATPKKSMYQVMSSHPHDVKEFTPYIETVKQEGRLWLVHLKKDMPAKLMENFRRTNGSDVRHYLAPLMKTAAVNPIIKDMTAN